jgi:hypothetical protein
MKELIAKLPDGREVDLTPDEVEVIQRTCCDGCGCKLDDDGPSLALAFHFHGPKMEADLPGGRKMPLPRPGQAWRIELCPDCAVKVAADLPQYEGDCVLGLQGTDGEVTTVTRGRGTLLNPIEPSEDGAGIIGGSLPVENIAAAKVSVADFFGGAGQGDDQRPMPGTYL